MSRPDVLHAEPTPRGDARPLRRALVFAFARAGNEDALLEAAAVIELADSRWQPACFAQDLFLAELIESFARECATIERLTMQDLKQEPIIYERLLVERNRNWLPHIEALFSRSSPALVVVGAAHLVGPDGLLKMLQGKGYRIEQL